MTVTAPDRLLGALLDAADLLGLPLTVRAVQGLAAETERLLTRPAEPLVEPRLGPDVPTLGQIDNLLARLRNGALTPAEAARLATGVEAVLRPARLACPVCGALPGRGCRTVTGRRVRAHHGRPRSAA